ncbi:hypothetical protein BRC89_06270 [Halobacteriales archaeon QS_4_70_19]|nr:MAG: hypothetical protein BRC89_06270 [Halobacteriales archaeon QS_4_70_19]
MDRAEMFEQSVAAVGVYGEDGRYIYVNDADADMLDAERETLIGHPIREFDPDRVRRLLGPVRGRGDPDRGDGPRARGHASVGFRGDDAPEPRGEPVLLRDHPGRLGAEGPRAGTRETERAS